MTTVSAINDIDDRRPSASSITPTRQSIRRWNTGLFVFASFGIVSCLAGLTIGFVTIAGLTAPTTTLYTWSTVLIGGSFILFGLAAHCLDKADAADKAIRLEYCRQRHLKN